MAASKSSIPVVCSSCVGVFPRDTRRIDGQSKAIRDIHVINPPQDFCFPFNTGVFADQELFILDKVVLWTSACGEKLIRKFTTQHKIKCATWATFYVEESEVATQFYALAILQEQNTLSIFSVSGEMVDIPLPCVIERMWSTPLGLLFERAHSGSLDSLESFEERDIPILFSLSHPFREICPISRVQHFNGNPWLKDCEESSDARESHIEQADISMIEEYFVEKNIHVTNVDRCSGVVLTIDQEAGIFSVWQCLHVSDFKHAERNPNESQWLSQTQHSVLDVVSSVAQTQGVAQSVNNSLGTRKFDTLTRGGLIHAEQAMYLLYTHDFEQEMPQKLSFQDTHTFFSAFQDSKLFCVVIPQLGLLYGFKVNQIQENAQNNHRGGKERTFADISLSQAIPSPKFAKIESISPAFMLTDVLSAIPISTQFTTNYLFDSTKDSKHVGLNELSYILVLSKSDHQLSIHHGDTKLARVVLNSVPQNHSGGYLGVAKLQDSCYSRFTTILEDGSHIRHHIGIGDHTMLVEHCLNALSLVLPWEDYHHLHVYLHAICQNKPKNEWNDFSEMILSVLCDTQSSPCTDHPSITSDNSPNQDNDWVFLLQSEYHKSQLQSQIGWKKVISDVLNVPMSFVDTDTPNENLCPNGSKNSSSSTTSLFPDHDLPKSIVSCLIARFDHVFIALFYAYQELKLDRLQQSEAIKLADLLYQLSHLLELERYIDYFMRDLSHKSKTTGISRMPSYPLRSNLSGDSHRVRELLPKDPPCLFSWWDRQMTAGYCSRELDLHEELSCFDQFTQSKKSKSRQVFRRSHAIYTAFSRLSSAIFSQKDVHDENCDALSVFMKARQQMVEIFVENHFTKDELLTLPAGFYLPLLDAIYSCRSDPPKDWSAEAYRMIGRPDLACFVQDRDCFLSKNGKNIPTVLNTIMGANAVNSMNTFINVNSPLEFAPVIFTPMTHMSNGTEEHEHLVDGLDQVQSIAQVRFQSDLRVQEVCRLLQSSKPCTLLVEKRPEMSDQQFLDEQQAKLRLMCRRTTALCVGRGMLTLGTFMSTISDKLPIPPLNLSGIMATNNALVQLNTQVLDSEFCDWPEFHNAVAAGLRAVWSQEIQSSKMDEYSEFSAVERGNHSQKIPQPDIAGLTRTWIRFNCPPRPPSCASAGMLLAFGLQGHLSSLSTTDIYEYLREQHQLTCVSILLGLAATYRGTMNLGIAKVLCMHLPSMMNTSFSEPPVLPEIQIAAAFGLGLLHLSTAHRFTTEFLLQEIDKAASIPSLELIDSRESYALACGLGLGLTTLGKGYMVSGLADLKIVDTLRQYVDGGLDPAASTKRGAAIQDPTRCSRILPGTHIHVDVTAPAAILALALMFLKTNDKVVSSCLTVPSTKYALDNIRSDFILLRVVAQSLILWDQVQPTIEWVEAFIPLFIKKIVGSMRTTANSNYDNSHSKRSFTGKNAFDQSKTGNDCESNGDLNEEKDHYASDFSETDELNQWPDKAVGEFSTNAHASNLDSHTQHALLSAKMAESSILRKNTPNNGDGDGLQVEEEVTESSMIDEVDPDELKDLYTAHAYIVAGACLSLGLRYAGSNSRQAKDVVILCTRYLRSLREHDPSGKKVEKAVIESCIVTSVTALGYIMAGSGDIQALALLRVVRRADYDLSYGHHMAIGMAIGMLFLSGGTKTLCTSNVAIAGLLCASYPIYPQHTNSSQQHLQALRHFYVLAVQSRCLQVIDVDSGESLVLPIRLGIKRSAPTLESRKINLVNENPEKKSNSSKYCVEIEFIEFIDVDAPTVVPELDFLASITLNSDRYWPIHLDLSNSCHRESFMKSHCLYVKKKSGVLSHIHDRHGIAMLQNQKGVQSLPLPFHEKWDLESHRATEKPDTTYSDMDIFLQYMFTWSVPIASCDLTDIQLRRFTQICANNCALADTMDLAPIYMDLFLFTRDYCKPQKFLLSTVEHIWTLRTIHTYINSFLVMVPCDSLTFLDIPFLNGLHDYVFAVQRPFNKGPCADTQSLQVDSAHSSSSKLQRYASYDFTECSIGIEDAVLHNENEMPDLYMTIQEVSQSKNSTNKSKRSMSHIEFALNYL